MKKAYLKRYEFSDGYVVCVKGFSEEELSRTENKHGALKKINGLYVSRRRPKEEYGYGALQKVD